MIYISLTTVPLRLNYWSSFKENLYSLLNQNTKYEYKILLNIPYYYKVKNNEEYVIPDELIALSNSNSKLIINRVNNDRGPVEKILSALSYITDPNDILIVCDDDQYYHEDMVEYHMMKRAEYPDCVICFRGDIPIEKRSWTEDGVRKYALNPTHIYFPVMCDSELAVPGHWHSVGYVRSFFDDDFMSEDLLKLSDNDDMLVGYYMKKKQILIKCVAWDGETDFRPVNWFGRPCFTFPIKYNLPFERSGFSEFRDKVNNHFGHMDSGLSEYLGNWQAIYTEK